MARFMHVVRPVEETARVGYTGGEVRMLLKLGVPALTIAALLACSPGGADSAIGEDDSDASPMDTDQASVDTAASDTDAPPPFVPFYWGLSGSWTLRLGSPDLTLSTTTLDGTGDGASCRVDATLALATPLAPPAEPAGLLTWWKVDLTPSPGEACSWGGPTSVELGLGQPDMAVQPAADRAGLSVPTSFGLYVRGQDGAVVVVGLAGTEAQLAGAPPEEASDTGPQDTAIPPTSDLAFTTVPDGVYLLHTLYALPLSSR